MIIALKAAYQRCFFSSGVAAKPENSDLGSGKNTCTNAKSITETTPEVAKPEASITDTPGLSIAMNGNIKTAINSMVANRFHFGSTNK